MALKLIDTDGENIAVRWFLAGYGACSIHNVGAMQKFMGNCGYPFWPAWCDEPGEAGQHLTKAGAQLWLRHLFNLESDTSS